MLYKIVNRLIPYYLGEKLPPVRNPFSDSPIAIFREFRPRTERFAQTFFPDAIKLWNTLMHFSTKCLVFRNSKNTCLVSSALRPKVYSIYTTQSGQNIYFNSALDLVNWEATRKITISWILPLIIACARLVSKTPNIFFSIVRSTQDTEQHLLLQ